MTKDLKPGTMQQERPGLYHKIVSAASITEHDKLDQLVLEIPHLISSSHIIEDDRCDYITSRNTRVLQTCLIRASTASHTWEEVCLPGVRLTPDVLNAFLACPRRCKFQTLATDILLVDTWQIQIQLQNWNFRSLCRCVWLNLIGILWPQSNIEFKF